MIERIEIDAWGKVRIVETVFREKEEPNQTMTYSIDFVEHVFTRDELDDEIRGRILEWLSDMFATDAGSA